MDESLVSVEYLESLLEENNSLLGELIEIEAQNVELQEQMYVAQLFTIGTVSAVLVCVILYKFLRQFY